jgi:bacterioferritin-associated ferredoxin
MVVRKSFICLCEDVTVEELRSAIRRGYVDIEDLKRITGIGTGPCQGKQCLHIFREILAEETGTRVESVPLTTLRPPSIPTSFGAWASRNKDRGDGR